MFDLDRAISDWRQQMFANGIQKAEVLDELESHLREDVERQIRYGEHAEKAFVSGVRRIGKSDALKAEFVKSGSRRHRTVEKLMLAGCILFVAFIIFLSSAAIVMCFSALSDRIAAAVAVAAILLSACFWPRAVPFLPVITNESARTVIALACILGGIGIATLYCQVILPHFGVPYDRQVPAAGFWMILPVAIGLGLGCGIDRAGRMRTAQGTT